MNGSWTSAERGTYDLVQRIKAHTHTQSNLDDDAIRGNRQFAFASVRTLEKFLRYDGAAATKTLLRAIYDGDGEGKHIPVSAHAVADRCCRGFCILVLMSRPKLIEFFVENPSLWDEKLPFRPGLKPPEFPDKEHGDSAIYRDFMKAQQIFCAHTFENFDPLRISGNRPLPFTECTEIGGGGSSVVYRVKIHPDFDMLAPGNDSHHYAVKTFTGKKAKINYNKEISAYQTLTAHGSRDIPGIIKVFTGFTYGLEWEEEAPSFSIVLELAEMGDLGKYLASTEPPNSLQERIESWEGKMEFLRGITYIHKEPIIGGDVFRYAWHGDLKPANILMVVQKSGTGSKIVTKIADFGHAQFRVTAELASVKLPNAHGTQTYGAPETVSPCKEFRFRGSYVTSKAEMWTVGCMIAMISIWTTYGPSELGRFSDVRKKAIAALELSLGISDCFHDGQKLLEAVRVWFRKLRTKCMEIQDELTVAMITLAEGLLVGDPNQRLDAEQALGAVNRALEEAKAQLPARQQSGQETGDRPTIHISTDMPRSLLSPHVVGGACEHRARSVSMSDAVPTPVISVTPACDIAQSSHQTRQSDFAGSIPPIELPSPAFANDPQRSVSAIEDKDGDFLRRVRQQGLDFNPPDIRPSPELSYEDLVKWQVANMRNPAYPLPGAREYGRFDELKDYNIQLLIDDSGSMREYQLPLTTANRPSVLEMVQVLLDVVQQVNRRGIDLHFMKEETKIWGCKGSHEIVERIGQAVFQGETNFDRSLWTLLRDYCEKIERWQFWRDRSPEALASIFKPRPIIIYIFTNGIWQSGNHYGQNAIRTLVNQLSTVPYLDKQVGIQFISFGDDQAGQKRLKALDTLNKVKGRELAYDIVDVEPCNRNMRKLLLGSIDKNLDADDP